MRWLNKEQNSWKCTTASNSPLYVFEPDLSLLWTAWQTGTEVKYAATVFCLSKPTKTPSRHQNPRAKFAIKPSPSMWRDICLCKAQRLFSDIAWCFVFSLVSHCSDPKLRQILWYRDSSAAFDPPHHLIFFPYSSSLAPFPSLPFSPSGSTPACRSGYLIHVQRHRFLIP